MNFKFAARTPDGSSVDCQVSYSTIEPAETGTDFGHAWVLSPPKVMDLTLLSCTYLNGRAVELTAEQSKKLLDYAENLILAGEGL